MIELIKQEFHLKESFENSNGQIGLNCESKYVYPYAQAADPSSEDFDDEDLDIDDQPQSIQPITNDEKIVTNFHYVDPNQVRKIVKYHINHIFR